MGPFDMGLRMLWPILMRNKCEIFVCQEREATIWETLAKLLNFVELVDFKNKGVG